MKQTFVISCWAGGGSYLDAVKNGHDHTFYRFACQKAESAKKYIRLWHKQAKERYGDASIYKHLTSEDAQYMIEDTPDGYNTGSFKEVGYIRDL